eukprot:TRINITY_DN3278_c0_g1_i9.p1 TRINITY_DN3278_c0_g1~~TRINITY_DN3278_c0_g1_i9.p1  ORF type:complete len:467 (-),score=85.87 TRINITY_DN3278_c0_g1_i9:189-1589(-)
MEESDERAKILANKLGSTNVDEREEVFSELKDILSKSNFEVEDFCIVWRTLLYSLLLPFHISEYYLAFAIQDDPKIITDLSRRIGKLIQTFPTKQSKATMLWIESALKTFNSEWPIMKNCEDLFHLLLDSVLRNIINEIAQNKWNQTFFKKFIELINNEILQRKEIKIDQDCKGIILESLLEQLSKFDSIPKKSLLLLFEALFTHLEQIGLEEASYIAVSASLKAALLHLKSLALRYLEPSEITYLIGNHVSKENISDHSKQVFNSLKELLSQGTEKRMEALPCMGQALERLLDTSSVEDHDVKLLRKISGEGKGVNKDAITPMPTSLLTKRKRKSMDIEEMAEEICKHSNEAELKERAARKKSSSSLEEDTIESSEEEEDEEEEESDSDYEKDIEDVIKGLPEYFFKTPREKKKYFGKLNDEYRKKMKVPKRTQSKTEGDKKVKINVKSNQTFGFFFILSLIDVI